MLNEASISNKENDRIANLKYAQEIILHKHPALLDNFLDVNFFLTLTDQMVRIYFKIIIVLKEILQFQLDKSVEVKKFVITFIEEAW